VTVWWALGCNGIIGPYWIEDADGPLVIVNTEHYIKLTKRKYILALSQKQVVHMDFVIYQQDGAILHCSNAF